MRYRWILLDVDGTLLDFHACEAMAFRRGFETWGLPWTQEIYDTYHNLNDKLWQQHEKGLLDREELLNTRFGKLFEMVGIQADGVAFEKMYREYLGDGAFLEPGALELLQKLRENACQLYIVTNGLLSTQQKRLSMSGIDRYVHGVFISEAMGVQKPKKEYFDLCFSQIPGFCRDEAVIIGDSLTADIQGGINAGIATCWYNPEGKTATEIKPDMEVHHLDEVFDRLS